MTEGARNRAAGGTATAPEPAAAPGPDGSDRPALRSVAERLYGLLPEEFTGERGLEVRRIRGAGHRDLAADVGRLRKPSTAAWLVNAMVRHRRDEVEQLLALGEQLREAQAALQGEELRELGRQRQQVLAAVSRQARALARELGHPVSEDVAEDVQDTLAAALADPAAAEAVREGLLTTALHYAGMGEVALEGAVALTSLRPVPTGAGADGPAAAEAAPDGGPGADGDTDGGTQDDERAAAREQARLQREQERRRRALEEADRDVQEAGHALARAEENLRTAAQRRSEAARRQVAVRRRVEELQARLHAAEAESVAAGHELRQLEHEHQAAERGAALARRMAERARARHEQAAQDLHAVSP